MRKALSMTLTASIAVTVGCFIASAMGHSNFLIGETPTLPFLAENSIALATFFTQFILWTGLALQEYSSKLIKLCAPYLAIHLAAAALMPLSLVVTTLLPMLYMLFLAYLRKDLKQSAVQLIKITAIIAIYQIISIPIKTSVVDWQTFNQPSAIHVALYSIDLIIFMLILYFEGVFSNVNIQIFLARSPWKHFMDAEDFKSPRADNEDLQAIQEVRSLPILPKIGALTILLGFNLVQWAIILIACHFGDIFLEGLILSISFLLHGLIIQRRWHSNSVTVCTITSTAIFYIGAKAIPGFYYTQLAPIVAGLLLVCGLYCLDVHLEQCKETEMELLHKTIDIEELKDEVGALERINLNLRLNKTPA